MTKVLPTNDLLNRIEVTYDIYNREDLEFLDMDKQLERFSVRCTGCGQYLKVDEANITWDLLYGAEWRITGGKCRDCR